MIERSAAEIVVDVGKSQIRLETRGQYGTTQVSGVGVSPSQEGDLGTLLAERILDLVAPSEAVTDLAIGSTAELEYGEITSLEAGLRAAFPSARILLADDGVFAHAATMGGRGTLLAVGTGVIAVSVGPTGTLRRFDGWGPVLGDRGAAVWVGARGLRCAMADVDAGRQSALRHKAEREYGDLEVSLGRNLARGPDWPRRVAAFALRVAELATLGDTVARSIILEGAALLAETAACGARFAENLNVVVTGRFGAEEPMRTPLIDALKGVGLRPAVRGDMLAEARVERLLQQPYRSALRLHSEPNPRVR